MYLNNLLNYSFRSRKRKRKKKKENTHLYTIALITTCEHKDNGARLDDPL